jgi:hypothetical protein
MLIDNVTEVSFTSPYDLPLPPVWALYSSAFLMASVFSSVPKDHTTERA